MKTCTLLRGASAFAVLFFSLSSLTQTKYFLFFSDPPVIQDPFCSKKYLKLFQKDEIDIRIIFGYKDARPARFVGDRYERLILLDSLLAPCPRDRFDCDFKRSPMDADLFIKYFKGLDHKIHKVHLRVLSSSASPDDEENHQDLFQSWKSDSAQKAFYEGLKNADIIFYNGHSRDGGGPDFDPPRLTTSSHVDYKWYRSKKTGFQKMQDALQSALPPPQWIGLFSCISSRLVPRPSIAAQSAWIINKNLLYFADALQNMKNALSDLLGMKCHSDTLPQLSQQIPGSALRDSHSKNKN